jgi:hypothetical protein
MEVELTNYIVDNNLTLIKYYTGQTIKRGAKSGQVRNSYCLVFNNNDDEQYYITLVNEKGDVKDIMIFNNLEKFKKVDNKMNPVWYKMSNGYVATNFTDNKKKVFRYFHQHILDHYETKDGISIDHINRCRTDNRLSNLRLATQSEQNYNQVRERGTNLKVEKVVKLTTTSAKQSFEHKTANINQIKQYIPKYVGYRSAAKELGGGTHGEHFVIEVKKKNPVTSKITRIRKKTTKSSEYSLTWKLILAIKIRYQLVEEYKWVQEFLEIDSADELADFADEERIVIRKLAKLEHLQETAELLDLKVISTAPKYRLERVKCSTCGKEVSKEALSRHIRLKH